MRPTGDSGAFCHPRISDRRVTTPPPRAAHLATSSDNPGTGNPEGDAVSTQYRKKPVVIEAMQFAGGAESATPIINWIFNGGQTASWREEEPEIRVSNGELAQLYSAERIRIRTLEGDMAATPGDFVIKGVQGEFYPCKPDIFEATYEAV